jgi:hypothetical protein
VQDILGNPSNGSGHFDFYDGSGVTLGMVWATYIDTFFWEADGTHILTSPNAAPGIYGTVIRFRSDRNLASLPFVVPFVHDPDDLWTQAEEDDGIAVMRALVPTSMPGDFDQDNDFDCNDVDALIGRIVSGPYDPAFDQNRDGQLNSGDLTRWLEFASSFNLIYGNEYLFGDANLDGNVDGLDFASLSANLFTSTPSWCGGDFNADGVVDGSDFGLWNTHRGGSASHAVPEPAALPAWALLWMMVRRLRSVTRRDSWRT